MQDHGDPDALPGEGGLTTEDLARPDTTEQSAVYPGEATTGPDEERDTGADEETIAGDQTGDQTGDQAGEEARSEPDGEEEPLLDSKEAQEYRATWSDIQGRFVDDPQDAVKSADMLVAEVMQTLARTFSDRKKGLEGQWDRGDEVATEDLRLALQHYRSFFNRLLKT
ncbi:hypothetical protein ACWDYJ_10040 [Streptomyces sp. NPDC003042]